MTTTGAVAVLAGTTACIHRDKGKFVDRQKRLAEWVVKGFVGGDLNLISNLPSGRTHGGVDRSDLKNLYWLQNCNLFAQVALRRFDPSLASTIGASYRRWYRDEFADLEEQTEHHLVVGRLPAVQPPEGQFFRAVIKTKQFDGYVVGTETIERDRLGTIQDSDVRNLLKYGVLGASLRGDRDLANRYFDKAIALWDGAGFPDGRMGQPGRRTSYVTRNLAYALLAERAIGRRASDEIHDAIEGRLWSLQDADGGIWTNFNKDGSIPDLAKKTSEIGPLTLLAYDESIWP